MYVKDRLGAATTAHFLCGRNQDQRLSIPNQTQHDHPNGAMQLVTGSPVNGGIIIPEHFKAAASGRRGLCKKIDQV